VRPGASPLRWLVVGGAGDWSSARLPGCGPAPARVWVTAMTGATACAVWGWF